MRAPVLCAVAVISLCLAGVLEFLAQKSQRQGGLALSSSMDDIPESVNIAYLYMPTTVAVLYSLLWTWIDLDVRRMQPWFELSRSHGARAEQSLLLNYPFEFLAFVPFTAWKQRHWPVFITGTVMMLVFWTITPLQGAIFGQQAVTVSRSTAMLTGLGLIPVEEQAASIDVSILNAAYGTTCLSIILKSFEVLISRDWYNQDLPSYTTAEYAMLPFSPQSQPTSGLNETWTANTTRFATDLNCWPATVTENIKAAQGGQYLFDNGQGCQQNISLSGGKEGFYSMQYIGYKNNAELSWYLANTECKPEFSNQFLAIFGQGTGTGANATFGNMTAMFCQPSYTQQEVAITVDAATGLPQNYSLVELASPTPLNNTVFNSSAFEFLLHAGFSSLAISRDYPDNLILNQYAKLYNSNISWPSTNMVGFAIGPHQGPLTDFLNSSVLQESFAAAHKLTFSLAISQLVSSDAGLETQQGILEYTAFGIVVSRPFSIAVEALLVLVAILAVILLYAIIRSRSNLDSDPDSTASLFRIIQKQDDVLSHLSTKDNLDETSLTANIRNDQYHLEPSSGANGPTLQLLSTNIGAGTSRPANSAPTLVSPTQSPSIRPKELRPAIGVPFLLVLAVAVGVLGYLKHQEVSLHGLTRPSQNFEVLQLLENYIPMVFSTMLEPFLVLINRLLCVLQPYYDLLDGKRSPRNTIETKYDSLPPQFVVWRAIKAGHYFLAVVSIVVLLANVLAVGLGAIFNESQVSFLATRNVTSLMSASLSRGDVLPSNFPDETQYYDHFYIVQTNMSADTQLPAWIDTLFTYLPFSDLISNDNSSTQYTAVTRGFGIEATCSILPATESSPSRLEYSYNTTAGPATQQVVKVVYEDTPYGNTTRCLLPGFIDDNVGDALPEGKSTHEFYSALEQEDVNTFKNATADEVAFCEERMVLGWMRYDTSQATSRPDMTFLQCTTQMVSANFSITVDADGHVLQSTRVGGFDNITEVMGPSAKNISLQANMLIGDKWHSSSTGTKQMGWHNDTLTKDWMNYYLKLATNRTDLVDPNEPLPDAAQLIPIVQDIYQRIGAALLGANRDLFTDLPRNQGPIIQATIDGQDTRIFMDNTALIISLTILGIYLLVYVLLYARQRKILLPRMPSTIGSTIAFVAGSRAVRLYGGAEKKPAEKYSFGRYVGVDGMAHMGIELDPYVVLLERKSPSLGGGKRRGGR
ncbi:hypothetical protein diail_734 [Diaporthe ilicicola]|nr:hypothetical protein diail_734 [Diaporthe ilicicola]